MKLKTILLLGLVINLALVSCSGENGEQGVQGEQGIQGVQGPQGEQGSQGEPGQDGNTNAQRIIIDLSDIQQNQTDIFFEIPELTQERLQSHYVLAYLKTSNELYPIYVAIPGAVKELDRKFIFYYTVGEIFIGVSSLDGSDLTKGWVLAAEFTELHLILIEIQNINGKLTQDEMFSLKNYGVDANDYNEVIRFFGLE
ncbi:collagen-like triple helix repeat-containing protein [Flagellimonas amoyensis]|uniref:collagen-like triple helix repeat-containing protein n=1 Tax=Flagellimonas amoyensis TaxID=2169401 RepID=UPI000D3551EC|nr:collagen-like protein [Allomuricauda amoyensis]